MDDIGASTAAAALTPESTEPENGRIQGGVSADGPLVSVDQGTASSIRDVVVVPPPITVDISDTRSSRARRWSRLDSIIVKNFKAIGEASIPLGDVTILVGPNGSGKSSVLQAVHWAARSASYVTPKNTKEMISFERLDYLPSSEPLRMAHKGELKSENTSPPTEVVFAHVLVADETPRVTVRIRAARNKGGITASMEGGTAVTPYKQRVQFITAYIPGLAGLSEQESILAQPQLRRQAASGNAGSVLRNVLLNIRSRQTGEADETEGVGRLSRLNEMVQRVHPNVSVNVAFDEREDYHIRATYTDSSLPNQSRPLETAATGILQAVQIFAYLILFSPKIMLIDEPDAHLHPDKQERLIETLEWAAREFNTQIILTTHSPHIVRAASPVARLVWMTEGRVNTHGDDTIRRLLGWGGLDKSALLFIEDEDDKPIRAILSQWPELRAKIAVCRCFGVQNLPCDKFLSGLLVDGQLKVKAVVFRDRDFMTDEETAKWRERYPSAAVFPWVTRGSDIEAYFCDANYLAGLYGVALSDAEKWRAEAAELVGKAHDTYLQKRREIMRLLWPDGGSPDAQRLWNEAGGKSPATVRGKDLYAQLKQVAKKYGKDEKLLEALKIPDNITLAQDLKDTIESAVSS
jgi:ABC-type lipoprotein export system ATPase subunit